MGWHGRRNLPDDEGHMRTNGRKKLFGSQSQVLKVENLRPSSSNLFDRNIQQLSVTTVALLPRPGFLKGSTIHDHVFSLPACQHHPGRVEIAVAKAGVLE